MNIAFVFPGESPHYAVKNISPLEDTLNIKIKYTLNFITPTSGKTRSDRIVTKILEAVTLSQEKT